MADEGLNKSAILLMSLGEDEAAEVFRHLGPREVQKISAAMAGLKSVTREQIESVLGEFCEQSAGQATLGVSNIEQIMDREAARVLEKNGTWYVPTLYVVEPILAPGNGSSRSTWTRA